MDSFQAKIRRETLRTGENKNYRHVPCQPTRNGKFQKNRKKLKKTKRIPLWLHFKPKHVEKGRERRKTKIIVPFRSYPTRNRNSKNIEKKFQKF